MRGIILLIGGVINIGVGIFVYFVIDMSFASVPSDLIPSELGFGFGELQSLFQYTFGGIFGCIGVIMVLFGLLSIMRDTKKSKKNKHIAQTGLETEATITFVDKNYTLLVNNRPIYSIVEYTYRNEYGNEYTGRSENLNTEDVIRNKVEVGGKIRIKYLSSDPEKSVVLM